MNPYRFKNLKEAIKACEEFKFNEQITRETLWSAGYELGRSRWYWGPDWMVNLQGWFNTQRERRAQRTEVREKEQIAIEAFRQELARDYGLENHPKEPKLWALALEHGHSAGYGEIREYYDDFSELLT